MEGKGYLDFDLRFAKSENGYRAEILKSPVGTAHGTFRMPFQDIELENYLLKIGQRRSGMRKADSPENRAARDFGSKLYDSVFQGDLQTAFRKSFDAARAVKHGLRVRLHLGDTPELADLPWEYLWQPERREFLALTTETPIVRYFDLPETVKPLAVTPPLRVLVMLSNPSDVDCLDVEKEWQQLKQAVGYLEERKLLILERLEKATLSKLQNRLRREEYHVFHFIGHGSFDPNTQESVLALEDEDGRKRLVSGPDLGIYLRDEPSLRLVLLNACEGARASRTDPFSGAAQSLVLKGIPAVIAMQFEVSDEAAIAMASGFYAALADDYPVDAALAEARKAVFAAGCTVEWGTPVLYLRAPDGRIFDVDKTAEQKADARREIKPPPLPVLPTDTDRSRTVTTVSQATLPHEKTKTAAAAIPTQTAPRRWVWLLLGVIGAFVALMGLGFWKMSQTQDNEGNVPLVTPTPTNSTPVETYGTPPPVDKNVYAGSPEKSREEQFADTKRQMQALADEQQRGSNELEALHTQAQEAIRSIKSAGTYFQPVGWWRASVLQPTQSVGRVYFQPNGRFSGENTTMNTSVSGSWTYDPSTSMLAIAYDDGSWLRLPLERTGDAGAFSGSFVQNGVTFTMSLEKEN